MISIILTDALPFAETLINLDDHDQKIIYNSHKLLLFNQEQTWVDEKRKWLVWCLIECLQRQGVWTYRYFLLNLLGWQYDTKTIGLHRYDGLLIFKKWGGPQIKKIKKCQQKLFKSNGLDIIVECNMKMVNHLDVTFNLKNSTYQSYQKPDNIIQHINVESNHPPNIIKQIKVESPSSPPMKK